MKKVLLMACVAGVMLLSENEVESTNAVSASTVFSQLQTANAEIARLQKQLEELRPVAAQGTNLKNVSSFLGDTDLSNLDGVLSETQLQEIAAMRALKQVDDITEIDTESNDPRTPAALLSPEARRQIETMKKIKTLNDFSFFDLSDYGIFKSFFSPFIRRALIWQRIKIGYKEKIPNNWCKGVVLQSINVKDNFGKVIKDILTFGTHALLNSQSFKEKTMNDLITKLYDALSGINILDAEYTEINAEIIDSMEKRKYTTLNDYVIAIWRLLSSAKNDYNHVKIFPQAVSGCLPILISDMLMRFPDTLNPYTTSDNLYADYDPNGNRHPIGNGFGTALDQFLTLGNNVGTIYNMITANNAGPQIVAATPKNNTINENTLWGFNTNINDIDEMENVTLNDYLALVSAIANEIDNKSERSNALVEPLKKLIKKMKYHFPCTPK